MGMDKQLLEPLSGFRDYNSPVKSWVAATLRSVFVSYGYDYLETPALERQEVLLGKFGEEAQKLLYLFEDNGGRKVGLRYDLTVPFSRFVANNYGSLTLPFKRYEIGPVWRAERPQKGRYRQFTQADIDIIGAPEPASELELLSVVAAAAEKLGIELEFQLNDRRIISALFDHFAIPAEQRRQLLILLDKIEKISPEEFREEFKKLSISDVQQRQLLSLFVHSAGEELEHLQTLLGDQAPTATLQAMLEWAKKRGVTARFVPTMVRGLDYYTGSIFEVKAANYDGGTVVAGGRYDGLIEQLTGQTVPAVGISFGVDRIADLLETKKIADTMFVVHLSETSQELDLWVEKLRQAGKNVEVYLDASAELGKQIKYASKRGYQAIYIPFENEWQKGEIVVKDLETGQQKTLKRSQI